MTPTDTGDLRPLAAVVRERLDRHFDPHTAPGRQTLALAEECGEFVGAYRRWSGQARRTGTFAEMAAELADVVITAFVTAEVLRIDLDEEIARKLADIHTRGWRNPRGESNADGSNEGDETTRNGIER